jgi:hypothetical protein
VLPPGFGSAVLLLTEAVLTICPVAALSTVPCIRILYSAPEFILPNAKGPFKGTQFTPSLAEYSAADIAGGMTSFSTTFCAVSGPPFVTVNV